MKCRIAGCGGDIDKGLCGKCGRLHSPDGRPMFSILGRAVFKDHLGEHPVANVVPFRKGQEGQGFTYYVLLSVANSMHLSLKGQFDVAAAEDAGLFSSRGEAITKARELGFEVEEYEE
jgi:hypothetical protein